MFPRAAVLRHLDARLPLQQFSKTLNTAAKDFVLPDNRDIGQNLRDGLWHAGGGNDHGVEGCGIGWHRVLGIGKAHGH